MNMGKVVLFDMANAQTDVTFLPTSRGSRYLCVGGYMYRVNRKKADGIICSGGTGGIAALGQIYMGAHFGVVEIHL